MQIIIVGCGNVGATIAKRLSKESHNITVIDTKERAVRDVSESLDLLGVVGSGTDLRVLKDAGIAGADLLIAVTDSDERNLLCCLIGKKAGCRNTIARVRNPEFEDELEFIKDDLGLSLSVNPELHAAAEMARLLKRPDAIEIDTFARGRVELFKFEIKKDSPLCGVTLCNMNSVLKTRVLVCIVERGKDVFIPNGDFTLWEQDKVSFVAAGKDTAKFFKAMNLNQGRVRSCMIAGGGETAYYLAQRLINSGVNVKIIESDKRRATLLAERLPEATIVFGDCSDKQLLGEEGIEHTESFVSLTEFDEENVMLALYARKVNPNAKLITEISRGTYEEIVSEMNIGSVINPKLLSGEHIVKYVRAMQNSTSSRMETLYELSDGRAEAMEFVVSEDSELTEKPLRELSIKPNVLIAAIVHQGDVEAPSGTSVIHAKDSVIVVSKETGFEDIRDILA